MALVKLRTGTGQLAQIVSTDGDTVLQSLQQLHSRLGRQVLVVVVIDLHHRSVDTGAQALDLEQAEDLVLGHVATVDPEEFLARLHDLVAAAAAQHARCRRAHLHKVFAHGRAVVHGVERRHLVHSHRWHLEHPSDFVHDGDRRESVLALAEVEQRHHRRLFVLWWVAFEDLIDESQVGFVEFEGDGGVVIRGVSVLYASLCQSRTVLFFFLPLAQIPGIVGPVEDLPLRVSRSLMLASRRTVGDETFVVGKLWMHSERRCASAGA